MIDLVIQHVDVLSDDTVIRDAYISVNGGHIAEISTETPKEAAKETIDGKGMLAAPGLVNTHFTQKLCA